jgi:hypothetical protein
MSNDLIVPSNLLPGGKAVEIINAPLRYITPILQTVTQILEAERQRKLKWPFGSESHVKSAKRTREAKLPRAVEMRQGYDLLKSLCEGGEDIDAALALKMVSVMHQALNKKKLDLVPLSVFAGLFDKNIDMLGTSLKLWKEVPRHPAVIAFGIQLLFHAQVFAPAPAELCSACRRAANIFKATYRDVAHWLADLDEEDFRLFTRDRDEWAAAYATPSDAELAATFMNLFVTRISYDPEKQKPHEQMLAERDAAIRELQTLAIK